MGNKGGKPKPKPPPRPPPPPPPPPSEPPPQINKKLQRQINRLKKQIEKATGIVNNDNTVLRRDSDILADLTAQLHALYSRQSSKKTNDNPLQKYLKQIRELQTKVTQCGNDLNNKQNGLNSATSMVNKLTSELTTLNKQFSTVSYEKALADAQIILDNLTIKQLNIDISNLDLSINNLTNQLINADLSINILQDQNYDLIHNIYDLSNNLYSSEVYNNQELLKLTDNIDTSLNNLFSYLNTQNVNPDVIYEKINYRDIEHQKLNTLNKGMNLIYYLLCFVILFIIICTGNIKREYFLNYLFIGLIPIIFPFLFKLGSYIIKYLSPNTHGPKNAFVDVNNTIFGYNI